MVLESTMFVLFLSIMRTVGWFPYTWDTKRPRNSISFIKEIWPTSSPGETSLQARDSPGHLSPGAPYTVPSLPGGSSSVLPGRAPSLFSVRPTSLSINSVKRNYRWQYWSVAGIFLCLAYFAIGLYSTAVQRGQFHGITTLRLSRMFYDVFNVTMGLLMTLYAFIKRDVMAEIVNEAETLCQAFKIEFRNCVKPSSFIVPLSWQTLLFSILLFLKFSRNVKTGVDAYIYIFGFIDLSVKLVFVVVTAVLYYSFISILSDGYLHAIRPHLPPNPDHSLPLKEEKKTSSLNSFPREESDKSSSSADSKRLQSTTFEMSLYQMGNQILLLQRFHQLVNRYYEGALTLSIIHSVITGIFTFFYISLFGYLSTGERVTAVTFCIASVVPLVVMTNAPLKLETQRDKLLEGMTEMYQGEKNVPARMGIEQLMNLLCEYQGFRMCGLFTLNRSLFVSVCSFMAMYLIILIQFHVAVVQSES